MTNKNTKDWGKIFSEKFGNKLLSESDRSKIIDFISDLLKQKEKDVKEKIKKEIKHQLEMTILLYEKEEDNGGTVNWPSLMRSFIKYNLSKLD